MSPAAIAIAIVAAVGIAALVFLGYALIFWLFFWDDGDDYE